MAKNPDWKVLPKNNFVGGNPRVFKYKDHDGGCNLIQIHYCKYSTNILSPDPDKVSHTVVKP